MPVIAALNMSSGRLSHRIRRRERWREPLPFLATMGVRWRGQQPARGPGRQRAFGPLLTCRIGVELVLLPVYGSWLDWIESAAFPARRAALNGTDHRTYEENAVIGAYVRWHSARAQPKIGFAASSPIRRWPVPNQGHVTDHQALPTTTATSPPLLCRAKRRQPGSSPSTTTPGGGTETRPRGPRPCGRHERLDGRRADRES